MTEPPAPHDDAGKVLREQWAVEQFLLGLGLVDHFLLDVLIVPTPRVARAMLALLREELPERRGEPLRVREFVPDPQKASALDPVETSALVADVLVPLSRPAKAAEGALTLTWVDASDARAIDDEAWTEFFYRLNERRNAVMEAQPGPLVLVLPYRLERTLAHAAPDVWSVRSGVYRVQVAEVETHVFDVAAERAAPVVARAASRGPRSFAVSMALMGEEPARFDDGSRVWVFTETVDQLLEEGRLDEAATVSKGALERARAAVAAAPQSKDALAALERALIGAESATKFLGEDARRAALIQEHLGVIDRLAGEGEPTDGLLQRRASARALAASYGLGGGLPLALAALADARALVVAQRDSHHAWLTLAQCLLQVAITHQRSHEHAAALAELGEAFDAMKQPEPFVQRLTTQDIWLMFRIHGERSETLSFVGRHDEALVAARAALESAKRNQQELPKSINSAVMINGAWRQIAHTYHRSGDATRASESLGEYRVVAASAFRRWPQSGLAAYWRVESLRDSAELALEQNLTAEARAWLAEALDLADPLLARVPDDSDVRRVVADLRAMQASLPPPA